MTFRSVKLKLGRAAAGLGGKEGKHSEDATLSNELKRVQESAARRANNARLQADSNAGTASLFDGLQKREDRHALELKNVKDQAELAASKASCAAREGPGGGGPRQQGT